MADQNARQPNILEDRKYSLMAPKFDGGKGQPKLFFNVFKGNVACNVFTNNPNEQDSKPIRIGLSGPLWGMLVELILKVTETEGAQQEHLPVSKGKPGELQNAGTLVVGKDEQGVVYLAPKAQGRQVIKFKIMPDMYADLVKSDGTPYADGDKSVLFTKGFIKIVDFLVKGQIAATWEKVVWQGNKGGGGGGWNKGGNGGGGGGYGGGGGGGNYGNNNTSDDFPM